MRNTSKLLLKKIVCGIFIIVCFYKTYAQPLQPNLKLTIDDFTKYTYKNGLSNDFIKSITQDDDGFIWIATRYGLNRFDGKEFVSFTQGLSPINLPSNTISFIKNLGNHQLGISTTKGFVLLNTKKFTGQLFTIPDTTSFQLYVNNVWDCCFIDKNRLAITTGTGFYVFTMDGKLTFRHDGYTQKDVGKTTIRYGREIFNLGNGEFIIFANDINVAYYNSKTNTFNLETNNSNFKFPVFSQRKQGFISRNKISDDEYFLLNYFRDTIIYYNHKTNLITYSALPFKIMENIDWLAKIKKVYDNLYLLNIFSGFYILELNKITGAVTVHKEKLALDFKCITHFEDKEGRLWLGSESGLYVQKLTKKPITSLKNNFSSLKDGNSPFTNNAVIRYKDKYYIGKYSKYDSCLQIVNANTLAIEKKIIFKNGLIPQYNEILSIQQYHNDTLWISTLGGVLWFNVNNHSYGKLLLPPPNEKYNNLGHSLLYPKDIYGNAWILYSFRGLIGKYNIASRTYQFYDTKTDPKLPYVHIKHIVYDSYGDVWVGGHGLTRYQYATNRFDSYMNTYAGPNKFNNNITEMTADDNGSLWLQTAENNLLEYKIKEKEFAVYNQTNGLPNDYVYSFSGCINNQIWMMQIHKLVSINVLTKKIQTFGIADGLPDDLVVGSSKMYYDSIAQKLIGIYEKQLALIPISLSNTNTEEFKIFITSIDVDNKMSYYDIEDKIRLPYDVQQTTFNFTVIDFENANEYSFFYKLNENEWKEVKYNRSITLNNLSSGHYTLSIKAINKSGVTVLKKIHIKVATPFWKTWWFISILALLISAIIYTFVKHRIKRIKHKASIDKQLADYEMKALHTQMNPHFIFNSLSSIKGMILDNKKDNASRYLSKFAKMIRLTLNHSTEAFVSLKQNNEYITHYLEIENLRFNNVFQYSIEVDPALTEAEVKIPPMMVQPLVENAIWHGLLKKEGEKILIIRYYEHNQQLICEVDDNGLGIHQTKKEQEYNQHQSVGLENIGKRLALLNEKYKLHCSLTITDKSVMQPNATGTIATITLPFLNS